MIGNEKFVELATKMLAGEISQEETAELKYIVDNDPSYKQQYDALRLYWKSPEMPYTDNTSAFNKIQSRIRKIEQDGLIDQYIENSPTIEAAPPVKSKFKFLLTAAAVLLFAGFSIIYILNFTSFSYSKANIAQTSTRNGQKSIITLTDGTTVTLNSKSTLKYPHAFKGNTREVTLIGEAFFDVKKDHAHPFIIHTAKMNIRVLGTAFNVKSYPKDSVTETTLLRGAIEVSLADRPSDRIFLKPNEKLIVKNIVHSNIKPAAGLQPDTGKNINNTQYILTDLTYLHQNDSTIAETAWMNNQFIFKDEAFGQLAQEMERWYGVEIVFKKDDFKKYHFTGTFEKETVTDALDALRRIQPFRYIISKSTIYIY